MRIASRRSTAWSRTKTTSPTPRRHTAPDREGIVADCKWPVSGRVSNLATSWNTRLARYAD